MTENQKRNAIILAQIERFTAELIAQGPKACRAHIASLVDGFPDDIREQFLTPKDTPHD